VSVSVFGAAFDRLPKEEQWAYAARLKTRKINHARGLSGHRWPVKAVLVGEKPGNGARNLPANFHHTPFYSTKNSSLWLNTLLLRTGINEEHLFWINSADMDGVPASTSHLQGWGDAEIIALGGAAEKWISGAGMTCARFYHPQAWKRFRSKEEYPLIAFLQKTCST
jgi:hypothetical protein